MQQIGKTVPSPHDYKKRPVSKTGLSPCEFAE